MRALLTRDIYTSNETFGILELFDDSNVMLFSCYTLEDEVRPEGIKLKTKTAIPEGRYLLDINDSVRFKRRMPIVYNTTGDFSVKDHKGASWSGIRIHSGNVAADTDGCILLGSERNDTMVTNSRAAFERFFPILDTAKRPILFEIINDPYTV